MGLQVRGTSVDGRTLVVDCRISINMASQTLEQVAGKRKMLLGDVRRLWEARTSGQALAAHANALRMHARARARLRQMGEQMADEARVGLAEKGLAEELVDGAAGMVRTKLAPMLNEDAQAFNRDVFFQEKVGEALKAKRSVELGAMLASEAGAEGGLEAAIERVEPLQANVVDLSEMALGEGGADVAVVVAWMRSNPSGLTRLKINVPKANAEVVAALHALVAQTATLVDLDAMDGRALTLNVLQLNGTEAVKSVDLSKRGLGPLSAAVIGACVTSNTTLETLK